MLDKNKPINDDSAPGPDYRSGLVSLRRFRDELGVVPSTAWRWIERGWLDRPINIGGRQYLTAEMIQRFRARAASGEFASLVRPPNRKGVHCATE